MLKITDLTFCYSRRKPPVLDGLSLSIETGGIYGLLGLNGVGKTTLLNLMAGLLTPGKGEVTLHGVNTRKRLPGTLEEIFFVPEEFVLPSMTIRDYARQMGKFYPRFSQELMENNLELFRLESCRRLNDLSMGQRKKAFLSFAIACNTSILLLDEPTNGLDLPGKQTLRSILASTVDESRTVILSTHQLADIQNIIDNVVVIRDGKILINMPLHSIAGRLRFELTVSPDILARALYRQPTFNGDIVILLNEDGLDSEIDLETLFNFISVDPDTAAKVLS